jgi:hypothetical protein
VLLPRRQRAVHPLVPQAARTCNRCSDAAADTRRARRGEPRARRDGTADRLQRVSGTGQDRDEDVVSRRSNDLQRASSFGLVRPFISAEAFVLGGEYHLAVHGARANDDQANQADPTRSAHVSHGLEAYRRRNRVAFTVTIYAQLEPGRKIEPVNLPRTPGCQPRALTSPPTRGALMSSK